MPDIWKPGFYKDSPFFADISDNASNFSNYEQWPELNDYNQLLYRQCGTLTSLSGVALEFVTQSSKATTAQEHYEVRIYQQGEIQTRTENWHDLFQVMIWSMYPEVKRLINQIHSEAFLQRIESSDPSRRCSVENTLTLFDECGAIIPYSDQAIADLICSHEWKELFQAKRHAYGEGYDFFLFGHALLEKCLRPYIGMTAHCILLEVDPDFFTLTRDAQGKLLDQMVAEQFRKKLTLDTSILQPFPMLGLPGMDDRNRDSAFYDNKEYFRPLRRHIQASSQATK